MTEAEWLVATNPQPMLRFLEGKACHRKLRLFACACCRRVWHILTDARSRRAVDLSECAADEDVPELDDVLREAEEAYPSALTEEQENAECEHCPGITTYQYVSACSAAAFTANTPVVRGEDVLIVIGAIYVAAGRVSAEWQGQIELVHDIFNNPFHPVAIDPSWRTKAVVTLAEGIYADKTFERMPVLADALEDAGCDNADILNHCRGDGPHVKGCWVVDLLLGKQ